MSGIKPKPVVFIPDSVLKIMADLKTNSRRIMRPQPDYFIQGRPYKQIDPGVATYKKIKPPHQPGDIVYVAEGYQIKWKVPYADEVFGYYRADDRYFLKYLTEHELKLWLARKKPYAKTSGRFMYRSLARIYLKILDVKAERIQNISMEDCVAEGIQAKLMFTWTTIKPFKNLWNSIHGPDAWERNDWCWCYSFKRCEKPEEE